MADEKTQWYNNKELFEMFTTSVKEVSAEIKEVSAEMAETKNRLSKYNGLHERFDDVGEELTDIKKQLGSQIKRCDEVQSEKQGKKAVEGGVLRWAGFVFGLSGWLAMLYALIKAVPK